MVKAGDILTDYELDERQPGAFSRRAAHYEVIKLYPHYVLCRRVHGGWRTCFGIFDLARMGTLRIPDIKGDGRGRGTKWT